MQGVFKVAGISSEGSSRDVEDLLAKSLRSLEMKIRSIHGVVDVKFQFSNWRKEKGQWIPIK